MQKISILVPVLVVVVGIVLGVWFTGFGAPFKDVKPVVCTMEAKICPDGTAVGRTAPNCEFAACPSPNPKPIPKQSDSGILVGKVLLGPVCPVERIPPDPMCAPKPYVTKIEAFSQDGTELIKTVQNQSDGSFIMNLPVGDYSIQAGSGKVYPRCQSEPVTIKTRVTVSVDINCDSGIR